MRREENAKERKGSRGLLLRVRDWKGRESRNKGTKRREEGKKKENVERSLPYKEKNRSCAPERAA